MRQLVHVEQIRRISGALGDLADRATRIPVIGHYVALGLLSVKWALWRLWSRLLVRRLVAEIEAHAGQQGGRRGLG